MHDLSYGNDIDLQVNEQARIMKGCAPRLVFKQRLKQFINSLLIDQFRYIKIQSQTIDLSTRLWGINTELVGFIPQSLAQRSIV